MKHPMTLIAVMATLFASAQIQIALQNFEIAGNNYPYTNSNGFLQTGNSTTADRPAASTFYATQNTGFRTSNTTATLTFDNINNLTSYHFKKISLRLAAFSIASSSNGMDQADKVTIAISLNNGISFSNELTVRGASNAYWHYTTATATANVVYDGNNIPVEFAPAGGGNRTTDGYSFLIVNLPDSCSQVKLRITVNNDSNNEAWLIDDVILSHCVAPVFINCPNDFTVNTATNTCNAKVNYNVNAMALPSPTYTYQFTGATNDSGIGIGSGFVFNKGTTAANITVVNPCGLSNCSFKITVNDSVQPQIICPGSLTVNSYANECADVAYFNNPVATDNCSTVDIQLLYGINSGAKFPVGKTINVFNATDANGNSINCLMDVTIMDKTIPIINCPPDISYEKTSSDCKGIESTAIDLGFAIATDNCGIKELFDDHPSIYNTGINEVNWNAIDVYGNEQHCIQKIYITPISCNQPIQIYTHSIQNNSALIKWKEAKGNCSSVYQLRIRKRSVDGIWKEWSVWQNANGKLQHQFNFLESNIFYNYQIRTQCGVKFSIVVNDWFWNK
jgi:hypothetical protein